MGSHSCLGAFGQRRPQLGERRTADLRRQRRHRRLLVEALEDRRLLAADDRAPPGLIAHGELQWGDADTKRLAGQVFFLDFDGAEDVTYDGPVRVEHVRLPPFSAQGIGLGGREPEIIPLVVQSLNESFVGTGVTFTAAEADLPDACSTIYVGDDDDAFRAYGSFLGLAEQVDAGNRDASDAAFVFSAAIAAVSQGVTDFLGSLVHVIGHEAGHLLGLAHADDLPFLASSTVRDLSPPSPLDDVAHHAGPDEGGSAELDGPVHQWLTYQAVQFYESQFSGSELGRYAGDWTDFGERHHASNGNDNDLVEGSFDEDVSDAATTLLDFHADIWPQNPFGDKTPYVRHFVAGGDGQELRDGLYVGFDSALERAEAYWDQYVIGSYSAAKSLGYYYLGHVAHLLQDMTVPAHVHNDQHGTDGEAYENWISAANRFQEYSSRSSLAGLLGYPKAPEGPTGLFRSLEGLFEATADLTEEYPSVDSGGNQDGAPDDEVQIPNTGRHRPDLVNGANGLSEVELNYIADDLMPWAIEQSAALFRFFYSVVDMTAPKVEFALDSRGTEEHPLARLGSTITLTATATDRGLGDSGIGQFRAHYRERAAGTLVWSESTDTGLTLTPVRDPETGDATVTLTLAGAKDGSTYEVVFSAEDGAGHRVPVTTYVQVAGRTGDVIDVDLKGDRAGATDFSKSFSQLRFAVIQPDGQTVALTAFDNNPRQDWRLTYTDPATGGQKDFARVIFADRADGEQAAFASTGRLYVAPIVGNTLVGDADPASGFQGRIKIDYAYRENNAAKTGTKTIYVLPGYSSVGPAAVQETLSADNSLVERTVRLQQRLNYLGFPDENGQPLMVDGIPGPLTESALRLFKAAADPTGESTPGAESAGLDAETARWLNAVNAPRWKELDAGGTDTGWSNADGAEDFDFGTSWAQDVIVRAGQRNASGTELLINDLSRPAGGPSTQHASHQAGMDIDVRLVTPGLWYVIDGTDGTDGVANHLNSDSVFWTQVAARLPADPIGTPAQAREGVLARGRWVSKRSRRHAA